MRTDRAGVNPFTDIRSLVPQPATIFDVGANIGQSAIRFRRLFPSGDIHSFEPSSSTFQLLTKAVANVPKMHVWNFGMGEECHRRTFFENRESVLSSFLPLGEQSWASPVIAESEMDISTVDCFCSDNSIKRIDILKSDTQGFDLNVLKGAGQMLRDGNISAILTEINFRSVLRRPRFGCSDFRLHDFP